MSTDKKFTGQRLDQTGLYYYGARYYDAGIGRFISPDTMTPSLVNPQALNRYSYCFNNPLKYNDPTGHWPNWGSIGNAIKNAVQTVVNVVSENVNTVQTVLDVAGMIPVVGEAFDAVNGIIYAVQGDAVNSALSFAACIPVAGSLANRGQTGRKNGGESIGCSSWSG
jgi:RHS repeat-associated protein